MGFDYLNPRESPTGREFLGGGRFGRVDFPSWERKFTTKNPRFSLYKSLVISPIVPVRKTKIKRSEELERFSVQGRGLIHFSCESPSFPLKIPSLRPCLLFEFPVLSPKILVLVFSSVNAGGRALHSLWSFLRKAIRWMKKRGGREREETPPRGRRRLALSSGSW